MARLFPANVDPERLAEAAHHPEARTAAALRQHLPDAYTVFWQLPVAWRDRGGLWESEIDLAIVNRAGEVLLIEQKNGPLIDDGTAPLRKRYGGTDKPIPQQMQRARDGLRANWSASGGRGPLVVRSLLYCPDHRVAHIAAAGLEAAMICDYSRRDQLHRAIVEVLEPGRHQPGSRAHEAAVCAFLAGAFQLTLDAATGVQVAHDRYLWMAQSALSLIHDIQMRRWRVRVAGAPGCGKTVLIRQAWMRALDAGKRPLLVCFNRPLRDRLVADLDPTGAGPGRIETLHGLLQTSMRALAGIDPPSAPDAGHWDRLRDHLLQIEIPAQWQFDRLIVDEGQDLGQRDFEILEFFTTADATILWVEDPDQTLQTIAPLQADAAGFVTINTRDNFRNPPELVAFCNALLQARMVARNPVPGEGVHLVSLPAGGAPAAMLAQVLARRLDCLLAAGYRTGDIVILTLRSLTNGTLAAVDRLGRHRVTRFTNQYAGGSQVMTPGDVLYDTVRRFKGLQAPVVVLTDCGGPMPGAGGGGDSDRGDSAGAIGPPERALWMTAATRALRRLEIVLPEGGTRAAAVTRALEAAGLG